MTYTRRNSIAPRVPTTERRQSLSCFVFQPTVAESNARFTPMIPAAFQVDFQLD